MNYLALPSCQTNHSQHKFIDIPWIWKDYSRIASPVHILIFCNGGDLCILKEPEPNVTAWRPRSAILNEDGVTRLFPVTVVRNPMPGQPTWSKEEENKKEEDDKSHSHS
jgi:hypothetical protein